MNKPIELTNDMTQQERIAAQNVNNCKTTVSLENLINGDNPIIGGRPVKGCVVWTGDLKIGIGEASTITLDDEEAKYRFLLITCNFGDAGRVTSVFDRYYETSQAVSYNSISNNSMMIMRSCVVAYGGSDNHHLTFSNATFCTLNKNNTINVGLTNVNVYSVVGLI